MGMLSKKRAQPRIVKKKNRRASKARNNSGGVPKELGNSEHWSPEKTAQQNFNDMGIVMNIKPSMRQSDEGKALLSVARVRLNKAHYAKQGILESDEEGEPEKKVEAKRPVPTKDLSEIFPEIKHRSQMIIKPTVRKLKADEREICKRLMKKYGTEAHARMARDIKINFL